MLLLEATPNTSTVPTRGVSVGVIHPNRSNPFSVPKTMENLKIQVIQRFLNEHCTRIALTGGVESVVAVAFQQRLASLRNSSHRRIEQDCALSEPSDIPDTPTLAD